MVVRKYDLLHSIMTYKSYLFSSKFWSLLCYSLGIKRRLSNVLYPQIDSWKEWQNSTIKAYLRVFVHFKQNDQARLLQMIDFVYRNNKNVSTSHILFEQNCIYYLNISFEKDSNCCSWLKTTDNFLAELRKLRGICQENFHNI